MLSSRCLSDIRLREGAGGKKKYKLTQLREEAKRRLEHYALGGRKIFAVWANEFESAAALDVNSWEKCVLEATQCDIFISLDASDAGWWKPGEAGGLGICHEELRAAVESGRGKVRVITLHSAVRTVPSAKDASASKVRNTEFDAYKKREGLDPFVAAIDEEDTLDSAVDKICDAVASALVDLAIRGKQIVRQERTAAGEALDWARLDLAKRNDAMVEALATSLRRMGHAPAMALECRPLALAEAFGNSWAREQLGKPFLTRFDPLAALIVIACYRTFTETQARAFFGHSAVMTVASDFGVFARDLRTHAQVAFLKNCRDSAAVASRLQGAMNWIGTYLEDYEHIRAKRLVLEQALG